MEFTGERFVPLDSLLNDEIAFEHLHRYHSVSEIVKNKVVLDIASGEGYGTSLLAKSADKVFGVDIDPEAVEYAQRKYTDIPNVDFIIGNAENIPLPDHSIDIVISYETIEHLSESTQKIFLKEIKRVLKTDGKLVISTPDKTNYSDRYGYVNEFHLKEFTSEEFFEFLKNYFKDITPYLQGYEIVSAITEEEPDKINNIKVCNWTRSVTPFSRKYLIAICSDSDLINKSNFSSVVFQVNKNYLELTDKLVEKEAYIQKLSAWGKNLDNEIIDKGKIIEDQQRVLYDQSLREVTTRKEIEQLKEQLNNYYQVTEKLKKQVNDCDNIIQELREQLNNYYRVTGELKNQVDDNNSTIQEQKQKIYSSNQELNVVNEKLRIIHDSEGWKFLKKYYNLKGRLLPEDSKRYKLLKKIINKIRGKENVEQLYGTTGVLKSQKQIEQSGINNFVEAFEKIEFAAFEQPKVSIIIPAYNGWHMNYKCLRSIKQNTFGVSYEIILADDASTDETKNIKDYIKNIAIIRSEKNIGFLKNCNSAALFAKGDYIHFLNNDTEVTSGWLSFLSDLMDKDPQIGLVGSKLVYPDGRLQEAGGIIWQDASGWNYGHNQDPEAPEFNYVKEVDYISGASIMVRKSVWEILNGFDEQYSPAYCEDADLAFAIRKMNMRVVYQPLSVVIHHEGFSHGSDNDKSTGLTDIKSYQRVNNFKFAEKWQDVLRHHFQNGENVFWARDKSQNKKTILIIDHYVPQYDKDAGSQTVFQYLKLFISLNMNVKFIGDNFFRHEPYTTTLQQLGIEVLYGKMYAETWKQWILDNKDKFDFVLFNRPHITIKYIDFIKNNTKAKTLYYGHDLHFIREQKQYEIEKDPMLLRSSEKWKQIETYICTNTDIILAPSEEEKRLIYNLNTGNNKVYTIKPYLFEKSSSPILNFSERRDVLFVGGFAHKPNVDAVLWFTKEIWPLIKKENFVIKFIIIGSNVPEEILGLQQEDIEVKGFVSNEELSKIYSQVKVTVAPLRYGAGVKGKTIEAMYNGIPLVSTDFGIEGLPGDISFISPKNNSVSFAKELIRLYGSDEELIHLSKMEVDYIDQNFNFNDAKKEMSEILKLPK